MELNGCKYSLHTFRCYLLHLLRSTVLNLVAYNKNEEYVHTVSTLWPFFSRILFYLDSYIILDIPVDSKSSWKWRGDKEVWSHHLNQWWPSLLKHIFSISTTIHLSQKAYCIHDIQRRLPSDAEFCRKDVAALTNGLSSVLTINKNGDIVDQFHLTIFIMALILYGLYALMIESVAALWLIMTDWCQDLSLGTHLLA